MVPVPLPGLPDVPSPRFPALLSVPPVPLAGRSMVGPVPVPPLAPVPLPPGCSMVPLPMPLVPLPVPPVPAVQSTGAVIKLTTKNPVMIPLTLRITYPSVSCTCLFMFLREDLHAYPLNARGNPSSAIAGDTAQSNIYTTSNNLGKARLFSLPGGVRASAIAGNTC
jgi:hypothetical protein